MDVTHLIEEVKPAPQVLIEGAAERGEEPRFYRRAGDQWQPYSWARFAAEVRAAACYLADAGMTPGDRGAIFAHNSIEWAVAALAVQALGGVMVPIYPASTAEQAAYIAAHAQIRFLFAGDDDLAARAGQRPDAYRELMGTVRLDGPARGKGEISWSEVLEMGAAADRADPSRFDAMLAAVSLDQPGMMLYTSGTSGPPKGVPLTHRNVGINGRDWIESNAPLLHEDAIDLLWLPLSHIFGFGEMTLGNLCGFTSYLATPKDVLGWMPEIRPTVFMSVPAYWEKLARAAMASGQDPAQALRQVTGGRLRFCLSGGAGLKREIKELFYAAGALIIEGYGLTETAPTLTINRPDDFRFDSVGKPLPSVELRLDHDGEILARGPNVFEGYHRNPEATAAAFTEDGWFRTGDIGRFTEDGFLQIVDRKKDILVTAGGKNVAPANLELRFCDDPMIEHLVVYGDGHKYLVAAVWPSAEAGDFGAFERHVGAEIERVNRSLARFETIKRFAIIEEPLTVEGGHLTSSLKLRRKAVYEAFRDRFEALYG